MITVERSTNYSLLSAIARNPVIYSRMIDDFAPRREDYYVPEGEHLIYILVKRGGLPCGFFCFVPQNRVSYEIHTVLLPYAFGPQAIVAASLAKEWMWRNTDCRRIWTNVPVHNRLALRFAKAAGMTQFGVNEKSYLRGGALTDQILLGLSRLDT